LSTACWLNDRGGLAKAVKQECGDQTGNRQNNSSGTTCNE
jgi:hypothetical protein